MSEIAVCFDIDGTLLTTARAGAAALEDAAEDLCGARPDLSRMKTAGFTDGEIAQAVLSRCDRQPPSRARVNEFLRRYEHHLPGRLPLRQGRVLDGVLDLLESLTDAPEVVCLLLTGNTERGAMGKLGHYGLAGYFDGGAFCTGPEGRAAIARRARELVARRLDGPADPERFYLVGDTPSDVQAGNQVGARTIAVASGAFDLATLSATGPWRAFETLPDPHGFARLVGSAPRSSRPAQAASAGRCVRGRGGREGAAR